MNSNFKYILLKIARLPQKDQHWILQQLSSQQQQIFHQFQGQPLLKSAQRFRKIDLQKSTINANLPHFCQLLAQKSPFYVAIVLEQGKYPWQNQFLKTFDQQGLIKHSLATQVSTVKQTSKQVLFNQWQSSLSFDDFLGSEHG